MVQTPFLDLRERSLFHVQLYPGPRFAESLQLAPAIMVIVPILWSTLVITFASQRGIYAGWGVYNNNRFCALDSNPVHEPYHMDIGCPIEAVATNRIPLRSLRVEMVSVCHLAHVSVQTFLGELCTHPELRRI